MLKLCDKTVRGNARPRTEAPCGRALLALLVAFHQLRGDRLEAFHHWCYWWRGRPRFAQLAWTVYELNESHVGRIAWSWFF